MSFRNFSIHIHKITLALSVVILSFSSVKADNLGDLSSEELKQFIQQYLMENPEVIIDSLEAFQTRQEAITAQYQTQALSIFIDHAKTNDEYPSMGPKDADVTLIEFFDYQCGYCKRSFPDMMSMANDDANIRVIFVELPILGPVSKIAALAALAANKQGKYVEFHTAMMETRGQLTEDKIFEIARDSGLDAELLVKDMKDQDTQNMLDNNKQAAESLGISGTPAFIIGDQIFKGAIPRDQMEIAVRQHRKANS